MQPGRRPKIEMRRDDDVLEVANRAIALRETEVEQVVDAADLEVREVVAVEDDAHRVGFGQAHAHLGAEVELTSECGALVVVGHRGSLPHRAVYE